MRVDRHHQLYNAVFALRLRKLHKEGHMVTRCNAHRIRRNYVNNNACLVSCFRVDRYELEMKRERAIKKAILLTRKTVAKEVRAAE